MSDDVMRTVALSHALVGALLGAALAGCNGSHAGEDPCEGRQCGQFDGKDCGTCPLPTEACSDAGLCEDLCAGRQCGPVPGGDCGSCQGATELCNDRTGLCEDACEGRECGEPFPGISCGSCQEPELCGLPGRCFVPGTCPADMVEVGLGGVCIDATEITCPRMAEFLTEHGNECRPEGLVDPDSYYFCIEPTEDYCLTETQGQWASRPGFEAYPITSVTFAGSLLACEAWGKRLCSIEEWSRACEGPDAFSYPYGNTYDPLACNACNDNEYPDCQYPREPENVGSFPGCEGGYGGLFDMIGNVSEWTAGPLYSEDGYKYYVSLGGPAAASSSVVCRDGPRGGSNNAFYRQDSIGFRCCLSLD